MSDTLISSRKKQSSVSVAWLLIVAYLLALTFTVSHNHQSLTDFRAELGLSFKGLNHKEHVGHWHSDQHHSASCQLIAQTPASLITWSLPAVTDTEIVTEPVISLPKSFPVTKRLTRAPPAIS
ncbi:hypothetical protein EOPP23_04440 [Endozoicomonas sp. OPT23]|uniref:hypothetical protein n=1 Tax=Endozoicomonas sp. OPT23 TaxID=2072845 RepID=UPI00129B4B6D|nr:hypothetical protein [Endozoicomonas sp. OPT23]MRI32241.1 hypothetical protein [Endozoicomonas sp. OPT23]